MTFFDALFDTLKDLPVAPIAGEVVQSVMAGTITQLAAPTGSGKSMMVPAKLADAIYKADKHNTLNALQKQVVVLVPRRFLAVDAAMNVAKMSGKILGNEVGYAIGDMGGEKSLNCDNTKLLFVTYGYAISSGLINEAQNIVLDEVHEASEDISLARAILHKRKKANAPKDKNLRLLEMSATIDAESQSRYWGDISGVETKNYKVDGSQLICDERYDDPIKSKKSITDLALNLLQKENRKGIAIFRPGLREIQETVAELQKAIAAGIEKDPTLSNVQVVQIYGGTPSDERKKARLAPETGKRKIIVGTNVIESGVNLLWVDSGISDGLGNIPYDRPVTGARALVQEPLAQWRIIQQRGRINRAPTDEFPSGIFILHSSTPMLKRDEQASPELKRRSVRNVAFRAACLGHTPDALKFDTKISDDRWLEAKEELMRLGLIDERWRLKDDGNYVKGLPVSPESGAILCEARRIDIAAARSGNRNHRKLLGEAIIMAALIEKGGMREKSKEGHGQDGDSNTHGGSDILDGLKAYRILEQNPNAQLVAQAALQTDDPSPEDQAKIDAARTALKAACDSLNVRYTSFCEAMMVVNEIRSRHDKDPKSIVIKNSILPDPPYYNGLKRCILNGSANRLFELESAKDQTYRDLLRDYKNNPNKQYASFTGYHLNPNSVENHAPDMEIHEARRPKQRARGQTPLLVGTLREMPSKGEIEPDTVIDQVTSIPAQVFLDWTKGRDENMPESDKLLQPLEHENDSLSVCYAGKATFKILLAQVK